MSKRYDRLEDLAFISFDGNLEEMTELASDLLNEVFRLRSVMVSITNDWIVNRKRSVSLLITDFNGAPFSTIGETYATFLVNELSR